VVTRVAIVGGGPAGLMAAEWLAERGAAVDVYERMPSVGRKFLLAGRGGLNLTHSEDIESFVPRYGLAADRLRPIIARFPPDALRAWAEGLGEETFVGSSGRVFPRAFKATPLLRAWLRRLDSLGVRFHVRHQGAGWDRAGGLIFDTPSGSRTVTPDATLLALGGASWPRLGADGSWVDLLTAHGVDVRPLQPANCGFDVAWSDDFRARFAGVPLKRIGLDFRGDRVRGEAMVTEDGLEGQAVYALASELREAVRGGEAAVLSVDLRPDLTVADLAHKLAAARPGDSLANKLRKAGGLWPVAIGLMREATGNDIPREPRPLARLVKAVPLQVLSARPLDRAISTAGGIALDALTDGLELRALPGVFVAGEMLDWEAPTGGYLLQACFATGVAAAEGILTV
jgi:uncharacterized flavoprotein (TIGR03862 family)